MIQSVKNKVCIPKITTGLDWSLNVLRRHAGQSRASSFLRVLRTIIHFGPWRPVPQFLIRQLRPAQQCASEHQSSLLDSLDANIIAEGIRQNSVVIAGTLPADFISCLTRTTDHLPIDQYQLVHHIDANILQLSQDPAIMAVLRAYLGCEPVLLESTLMVTGSHQVQGCSLQNTFHFDYAGWESLNVFVYLTDVTSESSAHMVAKGSHRAIRWRDMVRSSITDEEAQDRFGAAIETIVGPAGTLFFENTEAFHRRKPGNTRRVMLNLLYASHRSWLSHGRTSQSHLKKRAQAYELALRNTKT